MYYNSFNTGWTGQYDALSRYTNAVTQQLSYGDQLSYNWVSAGWSGQSTPPSDDAHYIGCLKCMYTAGMVGGIAGYFSYPAVGFNADTGTTPPNWLIQMEDLAWVHAFFTNLEGFLRNGTLLPGPNHQEWSTDLPAYEFPTGDATARVFARQLNGQSEWLICAWAAAGPDRDVTVTIPVLGNVTLLARSTGTVYRAKPGPVLTLLDTDGMHPTNGLCNIMATSGPNGSIASSGYVVVPTGANETFVVTPNPGYEVGDVEVDDQSQGPCPSYTFTNVTTNHTIAVTFVAASPFTLTVQSQPSGISLGLTPPAPTPSSQQLPANGTVTLSAPATAQVSGTSYTFANWAVNGVAQPAGQAALTFTLAQNTTVVALYLSPGKTAPVAKSQSVTAVDDNALAITLQASDADGDALSYSIVTPPANGTLTGVPPNVSYTANSVYSGADSFTFQVCDGMLVSNVATVSINNSGAPTANAQSLGVIQNTPTAITLTGSDPQNKPLTYSIVTQPANGTLSGAAPNVTYTPTPATMERTASRSW